jgi:hypothetical protein
MSLLSEKYSRFPSVDYADLICTDVLDYPSPDTEMPSYIWKTSDEEFSSLLQKQLNQANYFYLETRQPFITASMRGLLLDWVIEISSEFFLKRETCHKAISFIDRFLSVAPPVKKEHFQLLGLTSCIIACKLEEICYPKITDFIKSAGNIYNVKDIRTMERSIMTHLSWKVTQPTTLTVLEWLTTQWDLYLRFTFGPDTQLVTLKDPKGYKRYREILQLLDACILDLRVLKYEPKVLAACACYLILFKHFQAQNFELLLGNEEFEDKFDKGAQYFLQLFLNFLIGSVEISAYDELSECGEFMNGYVLVETSYDLPNVCRNGLRPEAHFVEFLAYQTYNPLCIQAVQAKVRSN